MNIKNLKILVQNEDEQKIHSIASTMYQVLKDNKFINA